MWTHYPNRIYTSVTIHRFVTLHLVTIVSPSHLSNLHIHYISVTVLAHLRGHGACVVCNVTISVVSFVEIDECLKVKMGDTSIVVFLETYLEQSATKNSN
jgi:hypothetical protein